MSLKIIVEILYSIYFYILISISPNTAYKTFANYYDELQIDKATSLSMDLVKYLPRDYRSYLARGTIFYVKERYSSALNDFENSMQIKTNYQALLGYGVICTMKYTVDKGFSYIYEAQKYATNDIMNARCYTCIGDVYTRKEDYKHANISFLKSLNILSNEEALFGIANIYYKQKRYDIAETTWLECINKYNIKSKAMKAKIYLSLSILYNETGKYTKAMYYIDKTIEVVKNYNELYNSTKDIKKEIKKKMAREQAGGANS